MLGKITKESSKILAKEHENILKVVKALDEKSDLTQEIDQEFFKMAISFIKNYADKFHHAKEEDILFKEFNRCVEKESGCIHCNPIEQMLIEHDEGRDFVKKMERALIKQNKKELFTNAKNYISLIQEHIFKEDNILYPMADEILNKDTEEKILEKFKEIAKANKNEEKIYISFVKSL